MASEIQLITDGEGLAVIGNPTAVEHFLASEGLASKDLGLHRLGRLLSPGGAVVQAGSEIAASGRWVKLTEGSAQAIKKYGLRDSATTGLSTGVLKGSKGQVRGFVEFAKAPAGAALTNPAILAGAAGIMAQVAMQQTMSEITDYLATIDEKVDDVLRAQKDAVLARMIGVGFVIDEAMTIRERRGRVDETTWSKIQSAPATIAETQAYALRQLDSLAEKLERKANFSDLAKAVKEADSQSQEWLGVLARSFQLQDAIAVLELDRVLDASPNELDGHRLGLKAARENRMDLISRSTEPLVDRMSKAAGTANASVLMHPSKAPTVVQSSNDVAAAVVDFHGRLGINDGRASLEARRWKEAAAEVKDRAAEAGLGGVNAAMRVRSDARDRARLATVKFSNQFAERTRRWRRDGGEADHAE